MNLDAIFSSITVFLIITIKPSELSFLVGDGTCDSRLTILLLENKKIIGEVFS